MDILVSRDGPVLAIEFMPQDEFDARLGLEPIPELLSVSEAAVMCT